MQFDVWVSLIILFLSGGLTPGPAVLLVIASSLRYGFWLALIAAIGVCVANAVWITLAATGAGALAEHFPRMFFALKLGGLGFICWIAWKIATQPVDTHFEDDVQEVFGTEARKPAKYGRFAALFFRGIGLQLANPNALVFFGGLLPAFFDTSKDVAPQAMLMIGTITFTEMFGLIIYAVGARALARWFSDASFARIFYVSAAILMVSSVAWAIMTQLFVN